MPDPGTMTGAGAGLASGGGLLGLAWLLSRFTGGGQSKLPEKFEERFTALCAQVDKLREWHDVADPDDATQRIWWVSKAMRQAILETKALLARFAETADEQNRAVDQLIDVVEQLREDVAALRREHD